MAILEKFGKDRFSNQENTVVSVLSIVGVCCCYAIVCVVCRMRKSDEDDDIEHIQDVESQQEDRIQAEPRQDNQIKDFDVDKE